VADIKTSQFIPRPDKKGETTVQIVRLSFNLPVRVPGGVPFPEKRLFRA